MTRILLLSDTHSFWDDRYAKYAAECDEIWHVGDIGTPEVTDKLAALKPLRAVYGNIDGADLRRQFPEVLRFRCEDAEVVMKHIGGYPEQFDRCRKIAKENNTVLGKERNIYYASRLIRCQLCSCFWSASGSKVNYHCYDAFNVLLSREIVLPLPQNSVATGVVCGRILPERCY